MSGASAPRRVSRLDERTVCDPCAADTLQLLKQQANQASEVATALNRLADVGERFLDEAAPALASVGSLNRRLDALCTFSKTWGRRLLWSAPLVYVVLGSITPNAAERLQRAIDLLLK